MEKIFNSYVDKDFLIGFLEFGKNLSIWETNDKVDVWRSLHKFLREKTKLAFTDKFDDSKKIEPTKRQNPLLRFLKKISSLLEEKAKSKESVDDNEFNGDLAYAPQSTLLRSIIDSYFQGAEDVEYVVKLPDVLDEISYSNIENYNFIFTANDSYLDIEKRFGVDVLTMNDFISNWNIHRKIHKKNILSRKVNVNSFGWEVLNGFEHPINSMIIADRYLFSWKWNMENNLFPLLKLLLGGQKLDIPFDLTILTEKIYEVDWHNHIEEDMSKIFRRIENFLKHELSLTTFNLTFCQLPKVLGEEMHDRQLFTNYFFIDSGFGFGCFDKDGKSKIKSTTKVYLTSITEEVHDATSDSSDIFIKEKLNLLLHSDSKVIGTKTNRLFDKFNKC